jgi:hypothetical protein
MAITQKRWTCDACHREWVLAMNWTDGAPCPACLAPPEHVHIIEFRAPFPGADSDTIAALQAAPAPVALAAETWPELTRAEVPLACRQHWANWSLHEGTL